jgi:DNA-directed RNA polymerase specialized sigma24 family protein
MKASDMPVEVWEHVRQALKTYFQQQYWVTDAEGLAQDTVGELYGSPFEFADPSDFRKVCYVFARNIGHTARRRAFRHCELSEDGSFGHEPSGNAMTATEMRILLEQVLEVARSEMSETDVKLLEAIAGSNDIDREELARELGLGDANNLGVRLHRSIKKLASLIERRRK